MRMGRCVFGLILSATLASGCYRAHVGDPRDAGPTPIRPDAPGPALPDAPGPTTSSTLTFVVSAIRIPEATPAGALVGFDLDGRSSDGAGEGCVDGNFDFVSSISGAHGVDNQLGATLAPLLTGEIGGSYDVFTRGEIAAGRYLVAVQITGVDGRDDADVGVRLGIAVPFGGAPVVGFDERLVPGQTFSASWRAPSTGRISGGRLHVTLAELEIPIGRDDVRGVTVVLPLEDVVIEADVGAALGRGEGGGSTPVRTLVDVVQSLGFDVTDDLIRSVASPDLRPDASGEICDAVSGGFAFEAASAIVVP